MKNYLKKNKKLITTLAQALIGYALLYFAIGFTLNYFNVTTERVQNYFSQFGVLVYLIFLVAVVIIAMTPLPDAPFVSAGIIISGVSIGFVIIWLGLLIAAVINFHIARYLGQEVIERNFPQTSQYINRFAKDAGFESIVAGRAFSIFSFDIVSFAAGLTNIDFKTYFFASLLGVLPVAINFTIFGAGIASQSIEGIIIAGILSIVIAAVLAYGSRLYRKKLAESES